MRTPSHVRVKLHTLMQLLNFRWAAVNNPKIGEIGLKTHEDFVAELDKQCSIYLKPSQLADLIHFAKEAIFESVKLPFIEVRNPNVVMRQLRSELPTLFKETKAGEVVMIELEEDKESDV